MTDQKKPRPHFDLARSPVDKMWRAYRRVRASSLGMFDPEEGSNDYLVWVTAGVGRTKRAALEMAGAFA